MPPGGGGMWCDTPVPNVRTIHQMSLLYIINMDVPALGNSLFWDTQLLVVVISLQVIHLYGLKPGSTNGGNNELPPTTNKLSYKQWLWVFFYHFLAANNEISLQ